MDIEEVTDSGVEVISSDLETISINSEEDEEILDIYTYYLDPDAKINKKYLITKVNLNFYQIWTLFKELPCIYNTGKCKYEWKIRQLNSDVVFSIYDWNNNKRLLDTQTWYLGCNVNDETIICKFLKSLCESIECYNTYYKLPIETNNWQSDIPTVNDILQKMNEFMIENGELMELV
jgi:hypothetical protein